MAGPGPGEPPAVPALSRTLRLQAAPLRLPALSAPPALAPRPTLLERSVPTCLPRRYAGCYAPCLFLAACRKDAQCETLCGVSLTLSACVRACVPSSDRWLSICGATFSTCTALSTHTTSSSDARSRPPTHDLVHPHTTPSTCTAFDRQLVASCHLLSATCRPFNHAAQDRPGAAQDDHTQTGGADPSDAGVRR